MILPTPNRTARWRVVLAAILFHVAALIAASPAAARMQVTDVRGRSVTIERPVRRISIDDGRYLVALALIHPNPVSLLAGWPQDVNRLGQDTYDAYLARFPALRSVPKVASSAADFNVESVIAARPDVAVVSTGTGPTDAQVRQLTAAGIPVVFIDFFTKPSRNLPQSLRILGTLAGRQAQAQAFLAFRAQHLQTILRRVRQIQPQKWPTVFVETHAGMPGDCCNSPGRGNVGDYITFVRGRNIGADVIPQPFGKLNLEYVLTRNPAVYIGTGGPHLARNGGLVLGAGYAPQDARASLARATQRRGIADLGAVRSGRAYGISHQLLNSPLDLVAIEVFAKWLHPAVFRDLDPAATLAAINRRFLAVPDIGTYWISLRP